ncbi:MAG: phage holin [Blautia obeum]|nr:phage holin [Blautia obeum]
MHINEWAKKIKKKSFWTALIPAALLVAQATAALFGYTIDLGILGNKLLNLVDSIFTVLLILGYDWSEKK